MMKIKRNAWSSSSLENLLEQKSTNTKINQHPTKSAEAELQHSGQPTSNHVHWSSGCSEQALKPLISPSFPGPSEPVEKERGSFSSSFPRYKRLCRVSFHSGADLNQSMKVSSCSHTRTQRFKNI